jgi:hypothetical protein
VFRLCIQQTRESISVMYIERVYFRMVPVSSSLTIQWGPECTVSDWAAGGGERKSYDHTPVTILTTFR